MERKQKRTMMNECYSCKFKANVPGDAHIMCKKPDPYMIGNSHGVARGWFLYPLNFDPCWKAKECCNYEEK